MSDKYALTLRYIFYIVVVISIAVVAVFALSASSKNKITNTVESTQAAQSSGTSLVAGQKSGDNPFNSLQSKVTDTPVKYIPTFAYSYNKDKSDFEIICQVKDIYECDLYAQNNGAKTLIKKYEDGKLEESTDNTLNVRWSFNKNSWNYGNNIVLVARGSNDGTTYESAPSSLAFLFN